MKRFVRHVALIALFMVGCGCMVMEQNIVLATKPKGDSTLSNLTISGGILKPTFDPNTTLYQVTLPTWIADSITVTPTANDPRAKIVVSCVQTVKGSSPNLEVTIIDVAVTASDSLTTKNYEVLVVRNTSSTYLKASNTGTNSWFGESVSISGDTIVVGAPGESSNANGISGNEADNGASWSGAVYVFTRTKGIWIQQAYLKASNTEAEDHFGGSVSISGDTIVIGAPYEDSNATGVNGNQADNSATYAGAAYVFTRTAGVWSQQAYLKASNTEAEDHFGGSVSISGDTIVVGACQEDSNASVVNGDQSDNSARDAGAVYVFIRINGIWTQNTYIKASNAEVGDEFGGPVSICGDTIVVGATLEDSGATGVNGNQADNSASNSGAAYVFQRTAGVWKQQAYLKASNTREHDCFGCAIAMSGNTVVVGAGFESRIATGINEVQNDNLTFARSSGAVYVFTRKADAWYQQAYIKASNAEAFDQFGCSVSISSDTMAVGAHLESSNATVVNGNQTDNSAKKSGAVYVFTRTAGVWSQQAYLKASNTEAEDHFGGSVTISDDTIVIGAFNEASSATGLNGNQNDNSVKGSGAVYVY